MRTLIDYAKQQGSIEDLYRIRDFCDAQRQLLTDYLMFPKKR